METFDKIALFDLDGTLADYHRTLEKDMNKLKAPDEKKYDLTVLHDTLPSYIYNRKILITSQPGWWENLPIYQPGFEILDICKTIGFKIVILTQGPIDREFAWAEKVKWSKSKINEENITITRDKSIVYGRVLIDDYPDYVFKWLTHRPRGLAVIPKSKLTNCCSVKKHPNIIVYNNKSMISVQETIKRLNLAFERKV